MDSMVEENGGNSSIDPLSLGGPTGNGTGGALKCSASSRKDTLLTFFPPDSPTMTDNSGGVEGAAGDSRQQQQQQQHHQHHQTNSSEFPANILTAHSPGLTVLKNSQPNVVHLITHPSQSSVIQSSVIQSANHLHPMLTSPSSNKGVGAVAAGAPPPSSHTVYVTSKSSSVIQAPGIRVSAADCTLPKSSVSHTALLLLFHCR